ncbi:MAG TPA: hypothetical protein PLU04_00705, partial [Anaerolineaceae bacterium]|nr:hypothetical protein [Anaerolineaceae bacterium]
MTQKNTSQPRRRVVFDRLTILLLIVFVILAIVTGVAVFRLVKNTVAGWNITPLEGVSIQSTTTVNGTPVSLPGGALQPEGGPTAEPWDGNSRVTILLMGLDYRDWEAGEVPRTDSMILLTIDPMTSSA